MARSVCRPPVCRLKAGYVHGPWVMYAIGVVHDLSSLSFMIALKQLSTLPLR